ncbi:Hypothetical protein Tpal_409 [Trichococcus palustris]|jgi:rhomboid protease GluP|uniref:Peptidase S54 rhomboid domain-containing protein n=1 Tax=Trichococcus palustris TaxID=140314 RepID=A0A143Y822_9LACT|nr:rhomboid family intramembrane serine protease [Trichococcus palustris]CZQ83178.1 Hypothetical protein Tpal_409 [Trichococcus palustris]SFK69190.1 rhomboid protease GluP [Trichococcus palustris]
MQVLNARKQAFRNKPYVTYLFLAIQIIIFVGMTFSGGSTNIHTLILFGAKYNPAIVNGEVWRLITPIFIHIGFTHLLVNSITLYYLGTQMEIIYGSLRFALIYLLSGLMGNIMSFAFSDAVSAGASTSLFGLFAAAIVLGRAYPHNYAIQQMARNFTVLIVLNFAVGFFSSAIDNFGHLGGALGGVLAALFIADPNVSRGQNKQRILALVIYFVSVIIFALTGFLRAGFALY